MTTTAKKINVEITSYEGSEFPEAAHYDKYVARALIERFHGVEINVSYGNGTKNRAYAYGFSADEESDISETIPNLCCYDLWDAFCADGYKAYSAGGVYGIQARSVATGNNWQPEGSGDRYDSEEEAEQAVRELRRDEPTNDDGSAIEYRATRIA